MVSGARDGVGPVGVDAGSDLPAGYFVVVRDRVQLVAQMKPAFSSTVKLSEQQLNPLVERLVGVHPGRRGGWIRLRVGWSRGLERQPSPHHPFSPRHAVITNSQSSSPSAFSPGILGYRCVSTLG